MNFKKSAHLTIFILLICLQVCSAITVDLHVKKDKSADVYIWLDLPVTATEKEKLNIIKDAINRRYPGEMIAKNIENHPVFENEGLSIHVDDLRILQDSLNCMDFSFSKSFFKEKFYMKVLLNPQIFKSRFFRELEDQFQFQTDYFHSPVGDGCLSINCNLPGHCLETNMVEQQESYQFNMSYKDFRNGGGHVFFRSGRFFPEIYWTVFVGLFLLVLALIRSVFRKKRFLAPPHTA